MSPPYSEPSLAEISEATHLALFSTFGNCKGCESYSDRGVAWYDSGVDYALLNGAWTRTHTIEPERAEPALQHFRQRNRPFIWWVLPSQDSASHVEWLTKTGFSHEEDLWGMTLDLLRSRPEPALPSGLAVLRLSSSDDLVRFSQVLNEGDLQAPGRVVEELPRVLGGSPEGPRPEFFIGVLDGAPVATAAVLFLQKVAGVYAIATIPSARRRGIGASMTFAAMEAGRKAGCELAVLTATALGRQVYRALGFEECGTFHAYGWYPKIT